MFYGKEEKYIEMLRKKDCDICVNTCNCSGKWGDPENCIWEKKTGFYPIDFGGSHGGDNEGDELIIG